MQQLMKCMVAGVAFLALGSAPVSEWDEVAWTLAHRSVAVTAPVLELAWALGEPEALGPVHLLQLVAAEA